MKMGIGCGALIAVACGTCGVFAYMKHAQDQETYGPLTAACDGQAVAGAAAYTPGAGIHRAILVQEGLTDGWSASSGGTPDAWLSTGVADTELVICQGEAQSETVETCNLSVTRGTKRNRRTRMENFDRTLNTRSYRLVAAATGETVAEGILRSEDPQGCYEYTGNTPTHADFAGNIPSGALEQWLVRASAGESDAAFTRRASDDVVLVGGIAGGPNSASSLGNGCSGSVPAEPQHVITFAEPTHAAFMALSDRDVDTTITVVLPNGQALCNDDYDNYNPGVEGEVPAGEARVYVGTFSGSGGNPPYRLRVSPRLPPTN